MSSVLFDMDKVSEVYGRYVDDCQEKGLEPMDFESWFDLELTGLAGD